MKNLAKQTFLLTRAFMMLENKTMHIGEKLVFLLIMGIYEEKGVITLKEIKQANLPTKEDTTANIFEKLKAKGLFTTTRSNQYFSPAFVTPTYKAFLLLRSFRSLVASLR